MIFLHQLPFSRAVRKFNLLVASYLFYAAWNPPFVLLLVFSTLLDWFVTRAIYYTSNQAKRRMLLGLSLLGNLGVLAFFKYGNFILENVFALSALAGWRTDYTTMSIVLPAGISFYTFQTLSYSIDVYRGRMKPWPSFLDYALYVTFFPQLVAGPIVRASDFLPQCAEAVRTSARQLGWGLTMIVLGLFQKIVLADGIFAPVVEDVYAVGIQPSTLSAWTGTLSFAGQIFCDFSGYSTCAIGTALCFGFHLPTNFRFPYAAAGFSDFWQRWHISLSTWLRDYLYIPLGGNRAGQARTLLNLMATMLIGGLWHGASWTFVVWGGLHGFYLVVERLLAPVIRVGSRHWGQPGKYAGITVTFLLVNIAWVFFRAGSFDQAWVILSAMTGSVGTDIFHLSMPVAAVATLVTGALVLAHLLFRDSSLESMASRAPRLVIVIILAMMLLSIMLVPGQDRAFIYFQF